MCAKDQTSNMSNNDTKQQTVTLTPANDGISNQKCCQVHSRNIGNADEYDMDRSLALDALLGHKEEYAEDEDEGHVCAADYRTLHKEEENRNCELLIKCADDKSVSSVSQLALLRNTYGVCTCLKGNMFPYVEAKCSYRGWEDHVTPTSAYVFSDRSDDAPHICPFCHGKNYNQKKFNRTSNVKNRLTTKRRQTRYPEGIPRGYHHYKDPRHYMLEYRRWHTVGCLGKYDAKPPVLGKDVPDPYMSRIKSYSNVMERMELMTARRGHRADSVTGYVIKSPSMPIITSPDNLMSSAEGLTSRLDAINLTPVSNKIADDHVAKHRRDLVTEETGTVTERSITASSPTVEVKRYPYAATMQKGMRSDPGHVSKHDVNKRDKLQWQAPLNEGFPSNNGPVKCKKFTSSCRYLDLSTPRPSFPLPIQIMLSDSVSNKMVAMTTGPTHLPRCKSANSSGSQSRKTNSIATPSIPTQSVYTHYAKGTPRGTDSEPSGHHNIGPKTKTGVYIDAVDVLNSLTNKVKTTGVTTGHLLMECMVKPSR